MPAPAVLRAVGLGAALLSHMRPVAAQNIVANLTSCVESETIWTTAEQISFSICDGTTYQAGGKSLQIIEDVCGTRECVGYCHENPKCVLAFYDKEARICHIKDSESGEDHIWAQDSNCDAIRKLPPDAGSGGGNSGDNTSPTSSALPTAAPTAAPTMSSSAASSAAPTTTSSTAPIASPPTSVPGTPGKEPVIPPVNGNDLQDGAFLASCPGQQTEFKGANAKYLICPGSDYDGKTERVFNGVASAQACAEACANAKDCKKAAYDSQTKDCHVKGAEPRYSLFLVKAQHYTTIRVEAALDASKVGRWSDLIRFPVIPVAAYVVPSFPEPSKLMFFSSWGVDAFGGPSGLTQFGSFDLKTGAVSQREISNTKHDMFCPGISALADGRILVQGGSDAAAVSVYDPATDSFSRVQDLKMARGYQSSVTLSDGRVFTVGGAYSGARAGKNGEVYDADANTWSALSDADVRPMLTKDHEGIWREDNHAWLFSWRQGSVFQAGPSKKQHWYGTKGYGAIVEAGTRDDVDAMCGTFVMYDATAGKILTAGGAQDYDKSDGNTHAHITTIGEPGTRSNVERVGDMAFPRAFANTVVLPDGRVIVTGGQRKALVFTNTDGILIPEVFDPASKTWSQMAPMAVPRNYHSVSILLPDATVFVGGGGLCYVNKIKGSSARCDKTVDHADGEIFEPPYLFKADGSRADRPAIANLERERVNAGETLVFSVGGAENVKDCKFSLVRVGTVTHSVNTDQRRVPLTDINVRADGKVEAMLPADYGVLTPGFWYLFAMSPSGVPSVARTVQVTLTAKAKAKVALWG
ncbi:hypothetical protein RB600_005642 [Gaeumannomyces tritici]